MTAARGFFIGAAALTPAGNSRSGTLAPRADSLQTSTSCGILAAYETICC